MSKRIQEQATANVRRYDLDAVRGLGALLVAMAHCALSYGKWTKLPIPVPTHKLFDELAWFMNPWLMPLFIVLAGATAAFALRRRSNRQYLLERLSLVIILVVGLFTFVAPSLYLSRVMTDQFTGSLPDFYRHLFDGIYPRGNFAFLHLWFLAYLFVYALVTLPLFRFLQGNSGRKLIDLVVKLCSRGTGLLLLALPLVALQVGFAGHYAIAEYPVFLNDGFRVFTLLYFFIWGYLFASDSRFTESIRRQWPAHLLLGLLTSAFLFVVAWPDSFDPRQDTPRQLSWFYAVFHTTFILCGWAWVVVALGLGQRVLAQPNRVMTYLGQASLVVYLAHPVFWLSGTIMVSSLHLPAVIGFPALTLFVFLGSLGTYEVCRRAQMSFRKPTAETSAPAVPHGGTALA
jgi:glucans biosynthesis protein C